VTQRTRQKLLETSDCCRLCHVPPAHGVVLPITRRPRPFYRHNGIKPQIIRNSLSQNIAAVKSQYREISLAII
jgi:hypothetical protein